MNVLSIDIKNLKTIDNLKFSIPLTPSVNVLCGANGVGKTTLLHVMSKLFNGNAYRDHFYHSADENSSIEIEFGDLTNRWVKNKNFTWKNVFSEKGDILLNGFIEGSFIHGNRFKYANTSMMRKSEKITSDELSDVSDDVRKMLGTILRKDASHYSKLQAYYPYFPRKMKNSRGNADSGFEMVKADRPLFIMEVGGKSVRHHDMSSGEFIVASLLEYIDSEIKRINGKPGRISDVSLVILDEIEVGLHPSALNRLMDYLSIISKRNKICFLIATHNPATMSKVSKGGIYLLQRSKFGGKNIKIVNPCYPAYAIRATKDMNGYDKMIFVEDRLAKKIIERQIILSGLGDNNLHKIMPLGGWKKVIELHDEFQVNSLGGSFCSYISILDGDIQEQYNKEKYGDAYSNCWVEFLPIPSLEKFLFRKLMIEGDDAIFRAIEGAFFNNSTLSFEEVIEDYVRDNPNYETTDKKGKSLLNAIKTRAGEKRFDQNSVENTLCDIAMRSIESPLSPNNNALEEVLLRFYR